MHIALLNSNLFDISPHVRKGTEIFVHQFIKSLVENADPDKFSFTAYASGTSTLPVNIESLLPNPISNLPGVQENHKHVMYELALISKAISNQSKYDLYHVNIGDGDLMMPFAALTSKPIVISLHHIIDADFTRKYFSLFKGQANVFFVAISEAQKQLLPDLNYVKTIHHGIDINQFSFNESGGLALMWAGRAIPHKGMDVALKVASLTNTPLNLFAIEPRESSMWWEQIKMNIDQTTTSIPVTLSTNLDRTELINKYQTSKAFIAPLQWEEPFGLVFIESMACGTPVVSYARGSTPEIIKDGETGFLVNPSEDDIRGNWIVKKTGQEGLIEAVERLYSLSESNYLTMRRNCRDHVEKNFTLKQMTHSYLHVYEQLVS